MEHIIKAEVLDALDKTYDGILSLSVLRKNKIRLTDDVRSVIYSLIDDGILKLRDCENFAVERVGNTKSSYGEQKFFNRYIHLTKAQLVEDTSKWDKEAHGLTIIIMDDIGSCINSKCVSNKEEGIQYFNQTYNEEYRYEFVILNNRDWRRNYGTA